MSSFGYAMQYAVETIVRAVVEFRAHGCVCFFCRHRPDFGVCLWCRCANGAARINNPRRLLSA